jgi:transcriptional regulator with XRE-family HTH domain
MYMRRIALSTKLKQDISIGNNLRMLRQRAGLSQEEAAAKLQVMELPVSREIISQMELGKYSIRISVLLGMKEIYKVPSMEEFFKELP